MSERLANLLGAQALGITDAIQAAAERAVGREAAAPGALVAIEAYPGESIGTLRQSVGLTASGTVRLVDRLAEDGLVQRRPGRDGRSVALHLTGEGLAALARVRTAREQALETCLESLDGAEREQLEALLDKVVAGLASDRPEALHVCRLCDREACCDRVGCPLDHTLDAA